MLNEIAQSFVIGAARSPMTEQVIILGNRRYALPEGQTATEYLLTQAGIAALTTLALTPAARPKLNDTPPFPVEPLSEIPIISHRAADMLKQMLSSDETELVAEALKIIGQRQQRIPPDLLPTVLDALNTPDKRVRLEPIRCAATQWLARQNPAWAWVIGGDIGDPRIAFEQETGQMRHEAFATLRRRNADEARTLLEETFPRENAEERAALLKQCLEGLSPTDEDFLESALSDRAKTVRQVAADLLARLPDSRFAQRILEKTLPLIEWKRGIVRKELQVSLPDEPGKEDERDGIYFHKLAPIGLSSIGPRQLHLAQRISYISPAKWKEHLGLDFPDMVEQFAQHEFALPLCVGFSIAAVRLKDTKALRALIVLANHKEIDTIYTHYVEDNLPLLDDFEDIVLAGIITSCKKKDRLETDLIAMLPAPWRQDITEAIFAWLKDLFHTEEIAKNVGYYYHLAEVLRLAATRMVADKKYLNDWPILDQNMVNSSQQQLAKFIDHFHKTLQTRIRFLSALEKP